MNLSKLKVAQLRKELQVRNLDTSGTRPVLLKRLKLAIENEKQAPEETERPASPTTPSKMPTSQPTTSAPQSTGQHPNQTIAQPQQQSTPAPPQNADDNESVDYEEYEEVEDDYHEKQALQATGNQPPAPSSNLTPLEKKPEAPPAEPTAGPVGCVVEPLEAPGEPAVTTNNDTQGDGTTLPSLAELKDEERVRMRKLKFSNINEPSTTAAPAAASPDLTTHPDKLKKRMERFSLTLDDDQRMRRRMQRFGIPELAPAKEASSGNAGKGKKRSRPLEHRIDDAAASSNEKRAKSRQGGTSNSSNGRDILGYVPYDATAASGRQGRGGQHSSSHRNTQRTRESSSGRRTNGNRYIGGFDSHDGGDRRQQRDGDRDRGRRDRRARGSSNERRSEGRVNGRNRNGQRRNEDGHRSRSRSGGRRYDENESGRGSKRPRNEDDREPVHANVDPEVARRDEEAWRRRAQRFKANADGRTVY